MTINVAINEVVLLMMALTNNPKLFQNIYIVLVTLKEKKFLAKIIIDKTYEESNVMMRLSLKSL